MRLVSLVLSFFLLVMLVGCSTQQADDVFERTDGEITIMEGGVSTETVKVASIAYFPDLDFEETMKNRCGASVDYRYCKCAFHRSMCKDLGVSKGEARTYLQERFTEYMEEQRIQFQEDCEESGNGIRSPTELACAYCPEETEIIDEKCVVFLDDKTASPEGEKEEEKDKEEDEGDIEEEEEEEDEIDPAEDDIVNFYASTICMVADPSFWEGFMDGENGREDGNDSVNPFLGRYGYGSEAAAEAALSQYAGTESFENKLSTTLGSLCPGRVDAPMFDQIITDIEDQYGEAGIEEEEDEEVIEDKGECKRDNECPTLCEGNIMRKQACQARDNSCVKTFDTDCTQVITTVDWLGDEVYEVPNMCVSGEGCVRGPVPFYERKEDLQTERKLLQAQSQDLNTLYQQATARCLGTLSDPTGLTMLIASTQDTTTNSPETNILLQQVADAPDATQTSVRCTLEQRLKTVDIPAVESELAILMKRVEETDRWTDLLDKED